MCDVNIIDIINCILSFLMMVIAFFALKGLYNLRKQQQEARYGFYINFTIFLQELCGLIVFGEEIPGWIKLLGMPLNESSNEKYKADKENLIIASNFSEKMLKFLRTSTNQVPPDKKTIDDWKSKFEIIKKFLIQVKFCQKLNNVFSSWAGDKCQVNYKVLKESVNGLIDSMNKAMKINLDEKL